jgi:hypothetical protein
MATSGAASQLTSSPPDQWQIVTVEKPHSITLAQDERMRPRQRYSSRQDRRMQWEGIAGRAVYDGDLSPFWKFLKFGEHTHAGHGCTFGLGRYRILD